MKSTLLIGDIEISLTEEDTKIIIKELLNPTLTNKTLREVSQRYKEALESGQLKSDQNEENKSI